MLGLLEQLVGEHAARDGVARERVEFTRRELREHLQVGDTQLKVHLARLVSLELVHLTRGAHGAYTYALAYNSDQAQAAGAGGALLPGLIDPDQHDGDPDRSGAGRPPVGGQSAPGRNTENASDNGASAATPAGSVGPDADTRSRAPSSAAVAVQQAAG